MSPEKTPKGAKAIPAIKIFDSWNFFYIASKD